MVMSPDIHLPEVVQLIYNRYSSTSDQILTLACKINPKLYNVLKILSIKKSYADFDNQCRCPLEKVIISIDFIADGCSLLMRSGTFVDNTIPSINRSNLNAYCTPYTGVPGSKCALFVSGTELELSATIPNSIDIKDIDLSLLEENYLCQQPTLMYVDMAPYATNHNYVFTIGQIMEFMEKS